MTNRNSTTLLSQRTFSKTVLIMCGCAGPLLLCAYSEHAHAQAEVKPEIWIDLESDHRVRGLSWSDGKFTGDIYANVPLTTKVSASTQLTALRGAERHGGADAGSDLAVTYSDEASLLSWHVSGVGHLFAGCNFKCDYAEVQGGGGGTLGPVSIDAMVSYAPDQVAIGGSNFYKRVEVSYGFWGKPISLRGYVGHSSGHTEDVQRARRLRPDGNYVDWSLGAEYYLGPASLTLTYSDTDISRKAADFTGASGDFGSKIVAGAHISF
ncbi:TorF family putative porin [Altericroceibacterium endophyticum]|uniref:Porin n=1 Tax=Altericroceibacterium endophyticum TaxID=1808508 RepID=A0A6I4T3A3_9SPHN|nr:TorF family putative porin [Altericroceibacterium endophyticum]MXO64641.1 hypothetical protein [Altericroceibacterium endophyticum]